MIITEVTKEEYERIINPVLFFNTTDFNYLNIYKVEELHFLLFKDSKIRFGLIIGEKSGVWNCPFSAPFGTFVNARNNWDIIQLSESINEFDVYMNQLGMKTRFQLPPEFYAPRIVCVMQNVLFNVGYKVECLDINYQLNLKKLYAKDYSDLLPRNGRKNLRISLDSGLELFHCETIEDKKTAYEIIRLNREGRGYPLNMSCDEVMNTIAINNHDMFIVKQSNNNIAAALVYHVSTSIAQVIYWGDITGFSEYKPINFLSHELISFYGKKGFEYLDIGISTDHGIINYGLSDFKTSIGCDVSMKVTLTKDYSVTNDKQGNVQEKSEAADGTILHNKRYCQNR